MKKQTLACAVAVIAFAAANFSAGYIFGREDGVHEVIRKVTEDLNSEDSKLMELRNGPKEEKEEAEEA